MAKNSTRIIVTSSIEAADAELGLGICLKGMRNFRDRTRPAFSRELDKSGLVYPWYKLSHLERSGLRSVEESMQLFEFLAHQPVEKGGQLERIYINSNIYFSSGREIDLT